MKTTKIEVSKLEGWQLDLAFAVAQGMQMTEYTWSRRAEFPPLSDIITLDFIEREGIDVTQSIMLEVDLRCTAKLVRIGKDGEDLIHRVTQSGPSYVVAAARCFIASKLGEIVDVPVIEGV